MRVAVWGLGNNLADFHAALLTARSVAGMSLNPGSCLCSLHYYTFKVG